MPDRETADAIAESASDWAARLDRGLSGTEQQALETWLAEDTRRVGALARARALWAHAATALAVTPAPAVRPRADHASRRQFIVGGSALAAGLGVAVWLAGRPETLTSGIGEVRRIALEDGSWVTLGTDTTIRTRFRPDRRVIEFLGGEAFLDITEDLTRPFIVEAGDMTVETTAAALSLRLIPGSPLAVMIERGAAVVHDDRRAPIRLAANQRLVAAPLLPPRVETLAVDAIQRSLAWREGLLAFDNEPLAQVAEQFRRYGPVRIVIADSELARQPVTGLFSASDPKGFARAIGASLGARAVIQGDMVRLERAGFEN